MRERVVFLAAGVITGIIGLSWLGLSLSSGAFAIQGKGFAEATGQGSALLTGGTPASDNAGLAGAAAALPARDSGPARVDVVPTGASVDRPPAAPATHSSPQTIIPF